LAPKDGFFYIKAQGDIIQRNAKSMLSNIGRRWVAGKRVIVGDEIKAIMLSLEFEVLAHCAEEVAYVKPA
jgi:hypothetical protein